MSVNLTGMSVNELNDLIARAEDQISERGKAALAETRGKIQKVLMEAGLTLEQVFQPGKKRGPGKGGSVPAKFFNPKDPEQRWSGRGRQPVWFQAALADGVTEQEMLIL